VYSIDNARGRYSMTVVDYRDAEKLHTERSALCQRKAEGDSCTNNWRGDVSGAVVFAPAWSRPANRRNSRSRPV
jgi:hypothetical protein